MESTQQQKSKTSVKAADAEVPELMLTNTGIMLIGAEALGDKLTGLIIEMTKALPEAKPAVIEFRTDNYPQDSDGPVFAMTFADTHSFAVNLEHCWHMACKEAAKGEEDLSMLGMLWINLLSAVGHELDHLMIAESDRGQYEEMRADDELVKALEESADQTATQEILRLARLVDIEIPDAGDMGWFGVKLMALFTTDSTKDLDWVIKLREQMEKGIVYDGGEDKQCFTLREFVKKAHDPDGKTGNWEQATTCVNLTAELETGETLEVKAEPVEAVKVELTPVAEVVEAVAAEVAPVVNGMFVGAGTTVSDEGPEVVMADGLDADGGPTIVMETVAAVAGMAGEVPLPAPVAAQSAVLTAAAATAVPAPAALPTTYEPNQVDQGMMPQIMENIWKTLYHHTFTKCGWQPNPQTGRFFFANPAAVLEGVSIQHIIDHYGAQNFVMEYDTLNAQGQFAPEMCQGLIRGYTTSKQGLPAYAIYLNINGQRIRRSFLPQNPEKRNAQNAYSNPAEEAGGQGHMIAWVYKDEVADSAPFKEKCAVKIRDNAYEVIS